MDGHVFHNATSSSFPIANTAQVAVNIYSGSSMNDAVFDIISTSIRTPAPLIAAAAAACAQRVELRGSRDRSTRRNGGRRANGRMLQDVVGAIPG